LEWVPAKSSKGESFIKKRGYHTEELQMMADIANAAVFLSGDMAAKIKTGWCFLQPGANLILFS
jgi:hypothetical protein